MSDTFLSYYNLREQPFGVTPDERFLFLSRTHREALASLVYGIQSGRGFSALIAPPGMGKTTLLFRLMEQLRKSASTVFISQTQCDSRQLLHYILMDMGIEPESQDLVVMHQELNEALLRLMRANRRFVLIIDEAQNLGNTVLETVRLLSNFETARCKLMQIVLSGQPHLAQKLSHPSLQQLRQRISIVSRLVPFNAEETNEYVDYRLRLAGYEGNSFFTPGARSLLAEHGQGIPRTINNLCFNALSLGFAMGRKKIDEEILREVLADLDLGPLIERPKVVDATPPVRRAGAQPPVPAPVLALPVPTGQRTMGAVALVGVVVVACALALISFRKPLGEQLARRNSAPAGSPAQPATLQKQVLQLGTISSAQDESTSSRAADKQPGHQTPESQPNSIVVEVQPKETLSGISRRNLGRYDPKVLSDIRELNPRILDPDFIKVGQQIRLPRPSVAPRSGLSSTSAEHDSKVAQRNRT